MMGNSEAPRDERMRSVSLSQVAMRWLRSRLAWEQERSNKGRAPSMLAMVGGVLKCSQLQSNVSNKARARAGIRPNTMKYKAVCPKG
jgi:hypothetical protein